MALLTGLGALSVAVGPAQGQTAEARGTIRILGIGDSLMAGYGLPEADIFPVRLAAALKERGHAVEVVNAGVSGDTTAGGRARLAWSLAENPDAVIVELGGNDGLRGLPPEETRANLDAMLAELEARGIPTLFAGMQAPPNLGKDYAAEFEAVFSTLAAERDVVFYPFFLEGVAADESLNQKDGIHPNPAGVEVIVTNILSAVEALIERVKAGKGS